MGAAHCAHWLVLAGSVSLFGVGNFGLFHIATGSMLEVQLLSQHPRVLKLLGLRCVILMFAQRMLVLCSATSWFCIQYVMHAGLGMPSADYHRRSSARLVVWKLAHTELAGAWLPDHS